MFWFTKKPSSGSHSQCLAKITRLVQCSYRRRADVDSVKAAQYDCNKMICIENVKMDTIMQNIKNFYI